MSYSSTGLRVRVPVRNRSQPVSSGKYVTKLKTKRTKPRAAWDNSVNDLTVHKLSPQELKRNHELHLPKKDHERLLRRIEPSSTKAFMNDTEDSTFFSQEKWNTTAAIRRKDVLRKEGFYDQERELNDLLSETDKTIAEVQDIFGDTIYKYKSVPVFTKAPHFSGNFVNNLSNMIPNDQTYYDTLSESIVRELNASSLSDDDESDTDDGDTSTFKRIVSSGKGNAKQNIASFQSKVNVDHYQNILSQNSVVEERSSNLINLPDLQSLSEELTNSIKGGESNSKCYDASIKENTNIKMTNVDALCGKAKKDVTSSALQTFNDMKNMLSDLESEIEEYEKETGKQSVTPKTKIPSSISGYTANLISAIIRLTQHLKQSEIQLKAEMAMRTEILDMFDDQRKLVDVLTNNLMELEEYNDSLKKELQSQKIICQNNHGNLKQELKHLETRLNLALANGELTKQSERKPFGNMTNMQVIP